MQTFYSSQGKRLRKNSLNEEQTFIFNFIEDILFFFTPVGKQAIFSKRSSPPPPPLNIKWSVNYSLVLRSIRPTRLKFKPLAHLLYNGSNTLFQPSKPRWLLSKHPLFPQLLFQEEAVLGQVEGVKQLA